MGVMMLEVQKQFYNDLKTFRKSMSDVSMTIRLYYQYLQETSIDYQFITVKQAQEFQSWLMMQTKKGGSVRYSKSTISHVIASSRVFYNYLKQKGLVAFNPFLEVKKVKTIKTLPKDIYSEEEMGKMLTCLKEFWKQKTLIGRKDRYKAHVIAELMYSTGMPIREVMDLQAEDIDFDRNVVKIRVPGRSGKRECILNEYTSKVLRLYVTKMKPYLFASPNYTNRHLLFCAKTALKPFINAEIEKATKFLRLKKFTTMFFRHALAMHLLRNGCDARYIQEIVGHKRLNTTQKYTKMDKKDLKNVIDTFHPRMFRR